MIAYLIAEIRDWRIYKRSCLDLKPVQVPKLAKYRIRILAEKDDLVAQLALQCRQWRWRWPMVIATCSLGLVLGTTLFLAALYQGIG